MKLLVLIATATSTALIAGLFYAWSCSVTIGLARLSNPGYIAAMQNMNRAILNPAFFMSFFGTALLLPLSTFLFYTPPVSTRFWCLLAATLIYLVGVMGITIFGNLPLNQALDTFQLSSASAEEIAVQRANFEAPWNRLNTIRTFASSVSIILVIIACIQADNC